MIELQDIFSKKPKSKRRRILQKIPKENNENEYFTRFLETKSCSSYVASINTALFKRTITDLLITDILTLTSS